MSGRNQTEPSVKRSLMNDHSVFASDEILSIIASKSCHMASFGHFTAMPPEGKNCIPLLRIVKPGPEIERQKMTTKIKFERIAGRENALVILTTPGPYIAGRPEGSLYPFIVCIEWIAESENRFSKNALQNITARPNSPNPIGPLKFPSGTDGSWNGCISQIHRIHRAARRHASRHTSLLS